MEAQLTDSAQVTRHNPSRQEARARSIADWETRLAALSFPTRDELSSSTLQTLGERFQTNHEALLSLVTRHPIPFFGLHSAGDVEFCDLLQARRGDISVVTFLERPSNEAHLLGLMEVARYSLLTLQNSAKDDGPGGILVFDLGGLNRNEVWLLNSPRDTSVRLTGKSDSEAIKNHCSEPQSNCRAVGMCESTQTFDVGRFHRDFIACIPWEVFKQFEFSKQIMAPESLRDLSVKDLGAISDSFHRHELGQRFAQQRLLQQTFRASLERVY